MRGIDAINKMTVLSRGKGKREKGKGYTYYFIVGNNVFSSREGRCSRSLGDLKAVASGLGSHH